MDLNKLYELHLAGEKPRLVVIPTFRFYRPVLTTRLIESCDVIKKLSYKKKQGSLNTEVFACQKKQNHTKFNHLPIILLHDSSPWEEANCYLMSLIENTHKFEALPSYQQLYRKALSIKGFSEFIVAEKINFKECKSRAKSPLRRYRFMLNEKMKIREISANTIKVTMLNLVSFYRYLIKTEKIKFQYPPWDEKERYIQYRGQSGNYINHRVISSDVSQVHGIKHANIKNAAFEGKIIDGGTLRPLSIDEQKTLIFTLKEVGSIEMTLVHLHGLITGARKQTILTYRRHQFLKEPEVNSNGMVCLYAGPHPGKGILADCKDTRNVNKLEKIWIPLLLYKKTQIYLNSERATRRLEKAQSKRPMHDINDQYLFLSQHGNPLYIGKNDPYIGTFKQRPNGQALETFIHDRLIPALRRNGFVNHYKFHDTRATAGMNLVRFGFKLFEKESGELTKNQNIELIFQYVKKRLNHASLHTTEQYLHFDEKVNLAEGFQNSYEQHLKLLMEGLV